MYAKLHLALAFFPSFIHFLNALIHMFKVSMSFLILLHMVLRILPSCSICALIQATFVSVVNSLSNALHKIFAHCLTSIGVSIGLTTLSILLKTKVNAFSIDLTNFFFSRNFLKEDIRLFD